MDPSTPIIYQCLLDAKNLIGKRIWQTDTSFARDKVVNAQVYLDKQASEIARAMCEDANETAVSA